MWPSIFLSTTPPYCRCLLLAAAAARPWLNANDYVLPFLAFIVLAAIVVVAAVAAIKYYLG